MDIDNTAAQQAIGAMLAAIQVRLVEAARIARAATACAQAGSVHERHGPDRARTLGQPESHEPAEGGSRHTARGHPDRSEPRIDDASAALADRPPRCDGCR